MDRFVEVMTSFVKVTNFSVKECEEEFSEMRERVSTLNDDVPVVEKQRQGPFSGLIKLIYYA